LTLSTRSDLEIDLPPGSDDLPVAVLRFADGQLTAANKCWESLTGLSIELSLGSSWLTAVHRDYWETAERFIAEARNADTVSSEWPLSSVGDRATIWVQATSGVITDGETITLVVVLTEIDGHKAVEAGLLHRASHDSLTGLSNRAAFMTEVGDACEQAATEFGFCAVLYLDLDHFKDINDHFGHQTGDRVLTAVARRLRSSLRPTDMLARLGGDELGVLCPALDNEVEGIQLAERIVDTVGQPFTIDHRELHTSVSVGVAFSHGSGAADLVEEADQAMYRAKAAGRAQWATMTAQSAAAIRPGSGDVGEVAATIARAERQLSDLLHRVDTRSRDWDRLVQGTRALERARSVLRGDSRIG
jgi:diguanylate cyclase (GGDEF)-like protein/PAS domain S-box-containing protein